MNKLNQINYYMFCLAIYVVAILVLLVISIFNSFKVDKTFVSSIPELNIQKVESTTKIFERREKIEYQDFNYSGIEYGKNEPF